MTDLGLDNMKYELSHMFATTYAADALDKKDDSLFAMLDPAYSTIAFPVPKELQLIVSIAQRDLDLQTELRQIGEELDRHHATLWEQERFLVTELYRTNCEESRNAIGDKLDFIRYEMIVISDQLDHGSDCSCDNSME
jgi:hypothetical protein